jgi:excisionase family DNA binding protein
VATEYLTLKQAAELSGLHVKTLMRLVRAGRLEGYKATLGGARRWYVSAESLSHYTDPFHGYLLDLPGPKLYLTRANDEDEPSFGGPSPTRGERDFKRIRGLRRKPR